MSVVSLTFVVAAILAALLIYTVVISLRGRDSALLRQGLAGTAVIQSVQQTQEQAGGLPVANIALDVTPEIGPGFQATAKQAISPSNSYLFQPGRKVPVRYDRKNRSNIVVVTDK